MEKYSNHGISSVAKRLIQDAIKTEEDEKAKILDRAINRTVAEGRANIKQTIIMEFFIDKGQDWVRLIDKTTGEVWEHKVKGTDRQQFNQACQLMRKMSF